jgi:serine/threonine protein kinase
MKVFIQNKGEISLTKNDFISSGGEGDVYAKGGFAFKIYNDSKKMIPYQKIQELSILTNKNIIKPEDILLDNKNNTIGYTMKYVKDTYSLCQLFPKAFKDRNSLSQQLIIDLVQQLQKIIKDAHDSKVLLVDLNELNFLVSKSFKDIYAIDVDSWQTKSYHATAIMESIRDRAVKNNKFTEGSDWFSFGIVSFQLFSSIHPYKGSHPTVKSLDDRMLQNISVFNKNVSVPKVCPPFDTIPEAYRNWFRAVFDDGKRLAPPTDLHAVIPIVTQIKTIIVTNSFDVKELDSFNEEIIDIFYKNGQKIVLTPKGLYINKILDSSVPTNASFISLPKYSNVIASWEDNGKIKLRNCLKKDIQLDLDVKSVMSYDNRLYVKTETNILELKLIETSNNIIASTAIVAQILPQASSMFDGVVIQNLLGAIYVSLFPASGIHHQFHIKELDKYKIIDAKYQNQVLMVIGAKAGKYDRLIIRFDKLFDGNYDVRIMNDIDYLENNFTVLDNGVCVHVCEDEKLNIFSSKVGASSVKEIQDPFVSSDMRLYNDGNMVLFVRDREIFSMKMK